MSRPRMTPELAEKKAREEFQKEVKHRRIDLDMSQKDLGEQIGVSAPSMCELLADPDKLSVARLRKIIRALDMSPETVLRLLGFDTRKLLKDTGAVIPMPGQVVGGRW